VFKNPGQTRAEWVNGAHTLTCEQRNDFVGGFLGEKKKLSTGNEDLLGRSNTFDQKELLT
jgi:hypothetical protein